MYKVDLCRKSKAALPEHSIKDGLSTCKNSTSYVFGKAEDNISIWAIQTPWIYNLE